MASQTTVPIMSRIRESVDVRKVQWLLSRMDGNLEMLCM